MNIAKQISFLANSLIAAVVVCALTAVTATWMMRGGMLSFQETTTHAAQTNLVLDGLNAARLSALKYRIAPSEDMQDELIGHVDEMFRQIDGLQADIGTGSDLYDDLERIRSNAENYKSSFLAMVELQHARNQLVGKLSDIGPATRLEITDIMKSAFDDNDAQAAYLAGIAQQNLMLARF